MTFWMKDTTCIQSLLSLLPPSCMVAPIRELVNTLYLSTSNLQNNQPELSIHHSINIEIDMPRGHSTHSSLNSSRETSAHSTTSSMNYVD